MEHEVYRLLTQKRLEGKNVQEYQEQASSQILSPCSKAIAFQYNIIEHNENDDIIQL